LAGLAGFRVLWALLCLGLILVAIAIVGAMAAGNIAFALGIEERGVSIAAFAASLGAGALVMRRLDRHSRAEIRATCQQDFDAGPVEKWAFSPSRAWNVDGSGTRALLFELDDRLLVFVASRLLEDTLPETFPQHLEIEALPPLNRILSLTSSGQTNRTEQERVTLSELGIHDLPVKKRRFVELAPGALDAAVRARLGLTVPASPPDAEPTLAAPAPKLSQVVAWGDDRQLQRRLVPRHLRRRAILIVWLIPAATLLVIPALAFHTHCVRTGAVASLIGLSILLWILAVASADRIRQRTIMRLLRGNLDATPDAWRSAGRLVHLHGRVSVRRTLSAILSGGPAVFLRLRRLIGADGLMQAEDFIVESMEGGRQALVDVRHSWLLHSSERE
jgi:hypothetical protein